MPKINFLSSTWSTIKEVDLAPLREQALQGLDIAVVGAPGSGRSMLVDQIRRDPALPGMTTDTPVMVLDLDSPEAADTAEPAAESEAKPEE